MNHRMLNGKAQERAAAELRSGEILHWCGLCGALPRGAAPMLVLLNVTVWVLCAVCVCLLWPHVAGLLLLLPAAVVTWRSYRNTRAYRSKGYMLTNHRVVWFTVGTTDSVSLPLTQNMVRRVVMKPAGRGDIVFATPADDEKAVFCNVPNVRAVVQLINDLSAGR